MRSAHKKSNGFNFSHELKTRKPMGITYVCCVCDEEFEVASDLLNNMTDH